MRAFFSFLLYGLTLLASSVLVAAQNATEATTTALPDSAAAIMPATTQGASTFGNGTSEPVALATVPAPMFSWSGYFEAIGIMLLLLGCLWLILWGIRRYGKLNFIPATGALPRDALRMEAQMPLGPKKGLVVVRFLNERLLLGVTEHHITLLAERLLPEQSNSDEQSSKAQGESASQSQNASANKTGLTGQPVTRQQFAEVLRARLFKKHMS